MHQAGDGGDGHAWVGEQVIPPGEGLIGGNEDAASLLVLGDQFEQHAGRRDERGISGCDGTLAIQQRACSNDHLAGGNADRAGACGNQRVGCGAV